MNITDEKNKTAPSSIRRYLKATLSACQVFALGLTGSVMLGSAPAAAAGLNFVLDQSNNLPDGENYLEVGISDGDSGAVNFTVTPLELLTDNARRRFGIQLFAFNVADGVHADASNVAGLPDGWKAFNNKRADGFGRYDIVVMGTGRNRQSELSFSLIDVDGDTPGDYALESGGRAHQGNEFFAARVKGLRYKRERPSDHWMYQDWDDNAWEEVAFKNLQRAFIDKWGNMDTHDWLNTPEDCWEAGTMMAMIRFFDMKKELLQFLFHEKQNRNVRAAFFGGSEEVSGVVPVPAGIWLLGSALAALAGWRRRVAAKLASAEA